MKIAIYSPYLDAFGGGERYMLTIAEGFSRKTEVDLLFDNHLYSMGADNLKRELGKRFNLDLSRVNVIKAPVGRGSNILERALFLKSYDILFYLTDGSIFYPTARKNILHIQSPLVGQSAKNLWGKLKLKGWDLIIYNSNFTKQHAQIYWPLKSEVVFPPVDIDEIKPLKKKKYILSVGRFFGYLKDKKQGVLIKAFKELLQNHEGIGWSLNLVGSAGDGDKVYLQNLKDLSKGLPIKFYPNLVYDDLIKLYGVSSIYWHASGFEEDDPTKMEHFGISTVEAMAGGCVPVVIGKGGQAEVVDHGKSGFLWNTLKELEDYTMQIIGSESLFIKMSRQACIKAKSFSKEIFAQKINKLAGI